MNDILLPNEDTSVNNLSTHSILHSHMDDNTIRFGMEQDLTLNSHTTDTETPEQAREEVNTSIELENKTSTCPAEWYNGS